MHAAFTRDRGSDLGALCAPPIRLVSLAFAICASRYHATRIHEEAVGLLGQSFKGALDSTARLRDRWADMPGSYPGLQSDTANLSIDAAGKCYTCFSPEVVLPLTPGDDVSSANASGVPLEVDHCDREGCFNPRFVLSLASSGAFPSGNSSSQLLEEGGPATRMQQPQQTQQQAQQQVGEHEGGPRGAGPLLEGQDGAPPSGKPRWRAFLRVAAFSSAAVAFCISAAHTVLSSLGTVRPLLRRESPPSRPER